jgi:hypothetical protein
MMAGTEVVGPVHQVTFGCYGERGAVNYTPPRDTLDPRYNLCAAHHVACDCREAEFAEERREYRLERQYLRDQIEHVLAGHPTYADAGQVPCQCTGCRLVRAAGIWRRSQ